VNDRVNSVYSVAAGERVSIFSPAAIVPVPAPVQRCRPELMAVKLEPFSQTCHAASQSWPPPSASFAMSVAVAGVVGVFAVVNV
jgi:hypothetical protein